MHKVRRRVRVVCPPQLNKGLFTVGALDNLDHNPSSTTAQSSFHGTGISISQFPTSTNPGEERKLGIDLVPGQGEKYALPEQFSVVPALSIIVNNISILE